MDSQNTFYIDSIFTFEKGINSGVAPLLLDKNQLSFAQNCTVRGGFVSHRPILKKLNLTFSDEDTQTAFETGLFQGAVWYRPTVGAEAIPCQIGGRLLYVEPGSGTATIRDISIPNDYNPASLQQAWLWQSENYLIVNNGQNLPIFYDGQTSRRSLGQNTASVGTTLGFNAPAVGANVEIPLSAPWNGQLNFTVTISGANYTTVSARTSSATKQTGFTITLENVFGGDGSTVPALTNVYAPIVVKTFLTAPFTMPEGLHGKTKINKEGTIVVTVDESTLNPNQVATVKIAQPWVNFPQARRMFIGGKLVYVNSVSSDGLTLRVFNCADYDTSTLSVFPIGTVAQRSWAFAMPQSVAAFITEDLISPAVGGSVVVKVQSEYKGVIGQYVIIGNQQYKITAKGTTSTGVLSYYLTIKNLTATPGAVIASGTDITVVTNELPPGRMGTYGMGRNWMALTDGRSFLASDIVGGSSGTPSLSNKDAVLNITENNYLAGGGIFVVPGDAGDIRAMIFTATLDTSLGQGALQVFTALSVFSCNAPVDRTVWQDLTNPILTQSLIGGGALGQYSTVLANGDTIFRSPDGVRSLILARREFNTWGNTPISREIQRAISQDSISLAGFGSTVVSDNRLVMTSRPVTSPLGTLFQGSVVINFDLLSSLAGKQPSVWEGLWLGINVLQWVKGRFAGVERTFAYTINQTTNKIEIYELSSDTREHFDDNGNGDNRIVWAFETACLFRDIKGKALFDLVKLQEGEFCLGDVVGTIDFQVYYRPQFAPCWVLWHSGSVCAEQRDTTNPDDNNVQPQNRVAIGLGVPKATDCDPVNNRPYIIGETFQFRFVFTGSARFYGATFKASPEPKRTFAPPQCKPICVTNANDSEGDCEPCKRLSCVGDADYELYEFQDLFFPLTPSDTGFFNQTVYYTQKPCGEDATLTYSGTLPSWIILDADNSRLVGVAGTYQGGTQEAANALAQNAIDDFGNAQVLAGNLTCESASVICVDGSTALVNNIYGITGYTNGLFTGVGNPPAGEPIWDGTFDTTKSAFGVVRWYAGNAQTYQMSGKTLCNAKLSYSCTDDIPTWTLFIGDPSGSEASSSWFGTKTGGDPTGVYTQTNGVSPTPATVTIALVGTGTTPLVGVEGCTS